MRHQSCGLPIAGKSKQSISGAVGLGMTPLGAGAMHRASAGAHSHRKDPALRPVELVATHHRLWIIPEGLLVVLPCRPVGRHSALLLALQERSGALVTDLVTVGTNSLDDGPRLKVSLAQLAWPPAGEVAVRRGRRWLAVGVISCKSRAFTKTLTG